MYRGSSSRFFCLSALLISFLLASGCARRVEVVPAPTATLVPGVKDAAEGKDAGVKVEAAGNAWSGYPYDLDSVVTPMEVWIRNESGKPLRISYRDETLMTGSGKKYLPLPPYHIRAAIQGLAPVGPAFGFQGFFIAPYYAPYYRWEFNQWGGPFDYDWGYYPLYYGIWKVHLPTRDMIRQAIPEGVLENGGSLNGFLYFQKADRSHRKEGLTFTFRLVDAKTQQAFGEISIPFVVK